MFGVDPYTIKEGTCFFRDKVSPVKAFATFAADKDKVLAGNKFMLPFLIQVCNYVFDAHIFFWDLVNVESYLSFVIVP